MMTTTTLEVEAKYDVDPDARLPDLSEIARVASCRPGPQHLLSATYYDTAARDLSRAGITLRRRSGGGDAGWHLKLPVDADRYELQRPLGPSAAGPPEALVDVVRGTIRDQPLVPVARIETVRSTVRLHDADDRLLAEVCDDQVVGQRLVGRPAPEQTWREWEVELHDASPDIGPEVSAVLLAAGARPSVRRAKLERVLEPVAPTPAPARTPHPTASAADVLGPYLDARAAEFRGLDPLVRADVPDGVHRMRVTGRRLLAVLDVYPDLFDRGDARDLRRNLHRIVRRLGRARDLEVLQDRLAPMLSGQPTEIEARIAADHRDAHRRVVEAMSSPRYYALVDALAVFAADPPWTAKAQRPARKVLAKSVAAEVRHLEHAVAAAAGERDFDRRASHLHAVRRTAKRLRYSVEAIEPVFGADAEAFRRGLTHVQNVLGTHHDAVVARGELVSAADPHRGLDIQPALAELDRAARSDEDAYRAAIAELLGPRLRRWLD